MDDTDIKFLRISKEEPTVDGKRKSLSKGFSTTSLPQKVT